MENLISSHCENSEQQGAKDDRKTNLSGQQIAIKRGVAASGIQRFRSQHLMRLTMGFVSLKSLRGVLILFAQKED
jgi:hypothetical protein